MRFASVPVLVILALSFLSTLPATISTTSTTTTTSTASTAPELLIRDAVMIEYPASTLIAFSSTYINLPSGTYSFDVPLPSIFGYTPQVAMCTSMNGSWYRYFFLYNGTQHYTNGTTVDMGYFGGYTTYINGTLKEHIINATAPMYIYVPPPSGSVTIYPDCAVSLQPPIIKTQTVTSTSTTTQTATQTTTQTKTVISTQTTTQTTTQTLTTTQTSIETTTATQTQVLTTTQTVAVPYVPLWLIVLLVVLIGTSAFFAFTSIRERHKERFYNMKNEDR